LRRAHGTSRTLGLDRQDSRRPAGMGRPGTVGRLGSWPDLVVVDSPITDGEPAVLGAHPTEASPGVVGNPLSEAGLVVVAGRAVVPNGRTDS
jgi:hypothetical protein